MRQWVIVSGFLALFFRGNAQEGVAWFCKVDSIQSGRFNVSWIAVFPASSGIHPAGHPKCSLLLENDRNAQDKTTQKLFYPVCESKPATGMQGTVLTIHQVLTVTPRMNRTNWKGTLFFDGATAGGPTAHYTQQVAFETQ